MPGQRGRRPTKQGQDDALARRWADAIAGGESVDALLAEIEAEGGLQSSRAVEALGRLAGSSAVPVLTRLLEGSNPQLAVAAAEGMGATRDAGAASALDVVARSTDERQLQKSARRSLYRLASQGIRVESVEPREAATVGSRAATIYRVIGSAFDGSGTRSLWFAADRPLGGIYMLAVAINDVKGIADLAVRDTTRKRFTEQETTLRDKDIAAWVELPEDYGRQLVQEAVDTARGLGNPIPPSYSIWADLVSNPAEPFKDALVYREVSGFEARMHPTLEAETPALFEQPEIEPWFFPPDRTRKWVSELSQRTATRLLVTPESEESRQERILREAVKELLPAKELHGLRRRLEETAFIFLRTDRLQDARRAVAAAVTIEEERPLRPPHPFVRTLIERSLRIGLEVERSGYEPARLARVPG